jgi:hypothetical protein
VLFFVFRPVPNEADAGASSPPDAAEAPAAPLAQAPAAPLAQAPDVAPPLTLDQALSAMRPRYSPGPFVTVVGMLPSQQVQGGTISWMRRGGRTIDTPWLVRHGELQPSRAPNATRGSERPALSSGGGEETGQPLSVVAGAPNWVRVRLHHPAPGRRIKGLHIAFGSYLGHFYLPADGTGQDGELGSIYVGEADLTVIEFGLDAAVTPTGQPIPPGQPFPVTMYIGAEDDEGNVSDYLTRQLTVVPVGTGDVEVTLSMTQPTDLDLYVVEPTGVAVYYRNTSSMTGGQLDLDANAACARNVGVNNEHVFWPTGLAPAGVYTVRVANYTSCIAGAQVDYRVTVRNCDETAVFAGSFAGPGNRNECTVSPGMDRGWCHDVVTFQMTPCRR